MPVSDAIDVTGNSSPAMALMRAIDTGVPGLRVIYACDWYLTDKRAATAALALYEQGRVDLVQQRIRTRRNDKFAYIAIKRKSAPAQT